MATKKIPFFFLLALLALLTIPSFNIAAQTTSAATISFDTTGFPQWAKDLRRWEIVAFGTFPFAMFTATFAMDTYRWADANGFDFSDTGRRYAPWPLKSAGAVPMENREHELTIGIAAGISVAVAVADLVIVQVKRHQARKRAESLPSGTAIIVKKPWPQTPEQEQAGEGGAGDGETSGGAANETSSRPAIAPGILTPPAP